MDRNLLLAVALSFAVLLLWSALQGPRRAPPSEVESVPAAAPVEQPVAAVTPPPPPAAAAGLPSAAVEAPEPVESRTLRIDKRRYHLELDTLGASLRHWELEDYRETSAADSPRIVLTPDDPPYSATLLTPFEELGVGDLSRAVFDVESEGVDEVAFGLTRGGIRVRKVYTFDPDAYWFRLRLEVENGSKASLSTRFAVNWPVHVKSAPDFKDQQLVAFEDGKVERQALGGFGKRGLLGGTPETTLEFPGQIDWAGVQTTYFLSALLPDAASRANASFVALEPGQAALTQVFFEPVEVPAGRSATQEFRVYAGPKEVERLERLGAHTVRSVDIGWSWLAPLTRAFGWLLRALYSIVPNYGWGIILLTIMVRAVTTPLTMRQMRSMERMRALAPKLQELREKHADDRERQSQEMMRLYKQEKVNPLGGCFPMLLQLPVFIGLYYALRSSIELRQAPFFGWIDDLSQPEVLFMIPGVDLPLRVLPLVMGATMVVQQRLTPMPSADPAQAKMMMTVMPIVMTAVFYQFPSGLVLYWMVSNLLAIGHQRWVGRHMHATKAAA